MTKLPRPPANFLTVPQDADHYWEKEATPYLIEVDDRGVGHFNIFCCDCGKLHRHQVAMCADGKLYRFSERDDAGTERLRDKLHFPFKRQGSDT